MIPKRMWDTNNRFNMFVVYIFNSLLRNHYYCCYYLQQEQKYNKEDYAAKKNIPNFISLDINTFNEENDVLKNEK